MRFCAGMAMYDTKKCSTFAGDLHPHLVRKENVLIAKRDLTNVTINFMLDVVPSVPILFVPLINGKPYRSPSWTSTLGVDTPSISGHFTHHTGSDNCPTMGFTIRFAKLNKDDRIQFAQCAVLEDQILRSQNEHYPDLYVGQPGEQLDLPPVSLLVSM